jgi:hypothetical protein
MKKYWLTISCVVALVSVSTAVITVELFTSDTDKPAVSSRSGSIEAQQRQTLRLNAEDSRSPVRADGSESAEPNEGPQLASTTSVDDAREGIRKDKAQKAPKTYPSRSLLSSDTSESERARQLLENPPQFEQNGYSLTERGTAFQDSTGALAPEVVMDLLSESASRRTHQRPAEVLPKFSNIFTLSNTS